MGWPFNYGGEYNTNLYSQIIIIIEDLKNKGVDAIEMLEEVKEDILK